MKVSANLKQMKVNKDIMCTIVKRNQFEHTCSTTNYMILLSFDSI